MGSAGPLASGGFIQWAHVGGNLQRPPEVMRQDNAQREELRRRGEYTPVRSINSAHDPGLPLSMQASTPQVGGWWAWIEG